MTHSPALSREQLGVHLETVVYPQDASDIGTLWVASVEHGGDILAQLTLYLAHDPSVDPSTIIGDVLGEHAASIVGRTLCFTEVDPGDLIAAAVTAEDQCPDLPLLRAYGVQQALCGLNAARLHMLHDVAGEDPVPALAKLTWPCGVTVERAAARLDGAQIEQALAQTHRGLRLVR